jgi:DNA replication ATP-dependent helicase Dna2
MLLQLLENTPAWLRAASTAEPTLVWLDTSKLSDAREQKRLSGFCNHTEVAMCKAVVGMMMHLGVPASDIGITSPYVQQVVSLQHSLHQDFQSSHDEASKKSTETESGTESKCCVRTAVMTIGQDKAAMVVSLVRSNADKLTGDLLQDSRRINVALTRARHKVVIVADASTVSRVPLLKKVLDAVSRLGTVFSLDTEAVQGVL